MRNSVQTLDIKEIMILTASNEIMLRGTQQVDHLRFDTQLYVDSTQLNKLINCLQKKNSDCTISEMFISGTGADGKMNYYFDGSSLENSSIELHILEQNQSLMQIRA